MATQTPEHAFDAAALKSVLSRYGDKIKYIKTASTLISVNMRLQNLPYITTEDLESRIFQAGGYDMLEITSFDSYSRSTYLTVIRIEDIIDFVVSDDPNVHIDPFRF